MGGHQWGGRRELRAGRFDLGGRLQLRFSDGKKYTIQNRPLCSLGFLHRSNKQASRLFAGAIILTRGGSSLMASTIIPSKSDPVIEVYKTDVDRTLLRENLRLSVQQRFENLMRLQRFALELQNAGQASRRRS